jgi:toxin ParE1/3/4
MRITWSPLARADLRAIRSYIAASAPRTADAFVARLVQSTERLARHPFLGAVVGELQRESYREILYGNYRIIDRVTEKKVQIVSVFHAARQLSDEAIDGS